MSTNRVQPPADPGRHGFTRHGFTLVELLVTIGIIVVLIGLLVPVVARVRISAQEASTKNFLNQLEAACENYQLAFNSYPGPLANNQLGPMPTGTVLPVVNASSGSYDTTALSNVTGCENLVLGVLGGLKYSSAGNGAIQYDPSFVGTGPSSLNSRNPKRYQPYVDGSKYLSLRQEGANKSGRYSDGGTMANDSIIPEFVDQFTDPLPILYLRANVGADGNPAQNGVVKSPTDNPVVTLGITGIADPQYDLNQIVGYTGADIGIGRIKPPGAADFKQGLAAAPDPNKTLDATQQPFNAYPYFKNPQSTNTQPTARQKDGYILISAGRDRIYGTADDITNFGQVAQ